MATLQQQVDAHNEEFRRGGGKIVLLDEHTVRATGPGGTQVFRLPRVIEANDYRLPGWFLAGIWNYLGMRHLNESPDVQHLQGWGFSFVGNSWRKSISANASHELIYWPARNELVVRPSEEFPIPIVSFPTASIFHAQKLFEEKGWFGSHEQSLPSLDLNDYIIHA